MFKFVYDPKAFLTLKRNNRRGLLARTQIIVVLKKNILNAKNIAEKTGLSYLSVLHHLHLLENEKIISKEGRKSYFWALTGAGQQRLVD